MRSSLPWAIIAAFLGFVIWRNGRNSRNILVPTPDLPDGYYAEGPHKKHCTIIRDTPSDSMNYCEDAAFWERVDGSGAVFDKVMLLSCDPSRKSWNTVMGPLSDPSSRGALWIYDIANADAQPQQITLEGYPEGHDFHPLGLDIYPSQPNEPYSNLFVVNHARHNSTIEQFTALVASAQPRKLVAPNALALTSPTSFYLTHDHRFTRRLPGVLGKTLPVIESILALPLAWVTHVTLTDTDATTTTTTTTTTVPPLQPATTTHTEIVASRIPFPNGVAISPDGTQVAIASTTLGEILFYTRDIATQALSLRARVPTPFAPDNIMFDERGSLIVAGHPYFQALVAVAANSTGARAPSWVVSITPSPTPPGAGAETDAWDVGVPVPASRKVPRVPGYEMRTLYQSDGSEFSSSSTALRDARTGMLYVVGLYQGGMMVCSPMKLGISW
ncbi:hypothetical protein DFH94DRAFT_808184 [Russula ochroleuca]|uniref:Calcium-dependent phosphotriesterase n=1 Tax=Russula ochroleuca TaxID=152965 RepID=A0A9P5TDK8_9AGAM|nr:hypothetical protein DFH94DRAFT_808184 [Russula ochroleuca]